MADENNITTLAKRLRPFIKMAAQEMVVVTPYDHGALSGLADDDHTQYMHNTAARTIIAVHTFDPAAAGPPFILAADAQGQTVIGLKADQLAKAVTAGAGLTGGGNLTDNISLTVGAGAGLTVNADDVALTTPGTLTFDSTNSSVGSHTHAITNSANPGAAKSILSTDASGVLTLVTLKTEVLQDRGITGAILINPTGDITLDPGGNDVLPLTNYDINLGALNKKYLMLHAAELWVETLVAQNTMATIGGRILVAPTTTLTRDLPAAQAYLYAKHNQMVNGDIVYLEADGKVEWILIQANGVVEGEGDYIYNPITRNLDGSGANDWFSGDAVLNTGTTGDGYIDIYSLRSVLSATHIGPTIVGNIRTGTTYSNLIEGWAVGNLNGLYGYGVDIYGAAFGKYINSSSFLTVDPTNGIRMIYKNGFGANLTLAQWDISGNLTIGQTGASQDNIYISAGSIALRVNTTTYINLSTAGVITIGLTGAGQDNLYISAGAISLRNNTTNRIALTSAGILTINDSGGAAVFTFDASAGAEITKKLTMPGTSSAIAIGVTPPTSSTAGTGIWIDRTGLFALNAGAYQVKIDATTGIFYGAAGGLFISAVGLCIANDQYGLKFGNSAVSYETIKIRSTTNNVLTFNNQNQSVGNAGFSWFGKMTDAGAPQLMLYESAANVFRLHLGSGSVAGIISLDTIILQDDSAGKGDIKITGGIYVGDMNADPYEGRVYTKDTMTITGLTADGYSASMILQPGYSAATAQTVTRHNYFLLTNPALTNVTITDACVFRFDAAVGTHKAIDTGTTKASPGTVNAWMKININGVVYYIPAFTSKTS